MNLYCFLFLLPASVNFFCFYHRGLSHLLPVGLSISFSSHRQWLKRISECSFYPCAVEFFSRAKRSLFKLCLYCIYKFIIIMILSLSIVIIAAVLGSVALFFLLGSNVADLKKQKILVIMGSLLLLAILISNFKSKDMFTFSLLNSSSKNKINSIFSSPLHAYQQKYPFDSSTLGDYLMSKNYAFKQPGKDDYNECIIYLSNNDEGASYFLYQLASKLRDQGYPAFYIKMQSTQGSSKQFFRKTGLHSYEAFKSAVDYYLQQKTKPFILIDNAQLLPIPIWQILIHYDETNTPHLIFNTENGPVLFERINELSQGRSKDSTAFLKRFQVQKFTGADQSALERLSPQNSFIKRGIINFKNIFNMKNGATQQEVLLKNSNSNSNVANYFGLSNYYTQIKRLLERGPVQFGRIRQAGIPYEMIEQMQNLGLIGVRNGQVILE